MAYEKTYYFKNCVLREWFLLEMYLDKLVSEKSCAARGILLVPLKRLSVDGCMTPRIGNIGSKSGSDISGPLSLGIGSQPTVFYFFHKGLHENASDLQPFVIQDCGPPWGYLGAIVVFFNPLEGDLRCRAPGGVVNQNPGQNRNCHMLWYSIP